jgi:isochorismate pyruvate lyase
MTNMLLPEHCETMAEVRAGVDRIDRQLIELLAKRFGYIDAAARIKSDRIMVRDEVRKAEVVENVRRSARAAGIPETVVAAVWEALIEGSIAYELERFDSLRDDAAR